MTRIATAFALALFLLPSGVFAATVYQPNSSYNFSRGTYRGIDGALSSVDNYLPFGNGQTGIPYAMSMVFENPNVGSGCSLPRYINAAIIESTTSATSTFTGNYVSFNFVLDSGTKKGYVAVSAASTTYGGAWTLNSSLDQNKYYGLVLGNTSSHCAYVYGSNSGGFWTVYDTAGFGNNGNATVGPSIDVNFVTERTDGLFSSVNKISPSNFGATASTSVNVSFSYDAKSDVSGYRLFLQDLTTTQALPLFSGFITPSTSGTITRNFILKQYHTYRWDVTLVDSNGQQTPQNSENPWIFNIGTTTINAAQTLENVQNIYATSTVYDEDGMLIFPTNATSTSQGIPSGCKVLDALGQSGQVLKTKLPFSYLCDFALVIQQLDQTNESQLITVNIPASFGHTATSVVLLDPSTLEPNHPIKQIRTTIQYAIWLIAGTAWIALIFKVL